MRVELLRNVPGRGLKTGGVHDLPEEVAAFLIKTGAAKKAPEPSNPPAPEPAAAPESGKKSRF